MKMISALSFTENSSFNPANAQSSSEEYFMEKRKMFVYCYVFPFHLVQYANTEFIS